MRRNDGTLVAAESDLLGLGFGDRELRSTGRFELVEIGSSGDVSAMTNVQQEQSAIDKNVCRFQRPEDGAWDPQRATATIPFISLPPPASALSAIAACGVCGSMTSTSPKQEAESTFCLTNDRGECSITSRSTASVACFLQEDTGNNPWVAKIWVYGLDSGNSRRSRPPRPGLIREPEFADIHHGG